MYSLLLSTNELEKEGEEHSFARTTVRGNSNHTHFFCSPISFGIISFEAFEKDADEDEESFSSKLGYF